MKASIFEVILEFLKKKKKRSIFHIEKKRRDKNRNTCIEIDNNNEIIKIINVLNSRVTTL